MVPTVLLRTAAILPAHMVVVVVKKVLPAQAARAVREVVSQTPISGLRAVQVARVSCICSAPNAVRVAAVVAGAV